MASRTSRRAALGQLASLLGLLRSGPGEAGPAQPPADLPVFRRGIGVAHAMDWADVEPGGGYVYPPFAAPRFRFDAAQRRAIRQAGFDFVRLAVDVGPFLAFSGKQAERIETGLIETARALLDDGLGVIVDVHPSEMNLVYRPSAITAGTDTPVFQDFLSLLTRTAAALERLSLSRASSTPPRLALELLNEPEVPPETWQPMLGAAYRAARRGAAHLPLVLGGGSQNSAQALEAIDTRVFAGDRALLYTFHDYEPWQFTHQGVAGNPAHAFDAVPYPAPATSDIMEAATERRIAGLTLGATGRTGERAKAREALRSYVRSGFDRRALEPAFLRLAAWRRARGLPAHAVLLGEFGAHLTPYTRTGEGAACRERWLRDMRELAEAQGFGWACWAYVETGGFALARDEVGPGFDAATTRALGLKPA